MGAAWYTSTSPTVRTGRTLLAPFKGIAPGEEIFGTAGPAIGPAASGSPLSLPEFTQRKREVLHLESPKVTTAKPPASARFGPHRSVRR
jgi:hypothetical protein